jgi:hypothetical protein
MPVSRDRSTSTPSLTATAVNEWPAPMALTLSPLEAAARMAAASSAASRGRAHRTGVHACVPDQFRHSPLLLLLLDISGLTLSGEGEATGVAVELGGERSYRC